MSDHKKDLTRIEDLGEFIHELNSEEEAVSLDDFTSEIPDLPSEASDPFATEEESGSVFGSDFDSPSEFLSSSEESEESNPFGEESSSWEEASSEDAPAWETPTEDEFKSDETTDFGLPSDETESSSFAETNWDTPSEAEEEKTEVPDTVSSLEETNNWEAPPIEEPIPQPVYTPPEKEYKAPETFADIKQFSESSSFTGMATEGNPSFSVLIKNVRYLEDVNDIIILLKELNLLSDTEEQTKNRLMRGMLLVPRISEYAAIFLAHKLRRFDIDIQLGLSDEIHPPKHQETPEIGIVSKHSLYQNQTHQFNFDDPKLEISQIIVSATSQLEGHQILRYMGVASEHKMIEPHLVEDSESPEIPLYYQELAQKLKAHALKAHSNAVIGLNYQLTPIGQKYRLTCTGNLVWVSKL